MIPGTSVCVGATLPPGDALHDPKRVGVVVVRREHDFEMDATADDDERREQRPPERVDGEALEDLGGEPQQDGVEHQREQEAERERERQPQRGEHRRQYRVQAPITRATSKRAAELAM